MVLTFTACLRFESSQALTHAMLSSCVSGSVHGSPLTAACPISALALFFAKTMLGLGPERLSCLSKAHTCP